MDYFAWRREKLVAAFPPDLDLLAISNPLNVTYLTGFTGDSTWLLVSKQGAFVLVSDGRYEVQIQEECPGLDAVIRTPDQSTLKLVAETVQKLKPTVVGFEANHLTVRELESLRDFVPAVRWGSTAGIVEALRKVKDDSEIAQIREAVSIAQKAYGLLTSKLRGGDTERELVAAMEGFLRNSGGTGSSFPPIVAVGDRSALPHAKPGSRRLDESPFLLLDWGATGELYKSDITRILLTEKLLGTSSSESREIESRLEKLYTVVLQAQQIAIKTIRAGMIASEIDKAVRTFFEKEGVLSQFNHGLGHGIGLQIHEGPFLRPTCDEVLEAGNVVTVEPGLYVPGFGGVRIEDDVLVTPDGCEVLTSLPKDVASVFGH